MAMSRPMQQQPGVPDTEDINTSIKSRKKDAVYVKYRDQWYIVDEGSAMSPRTISLFDGVIFVNKKGEYEVAKDREGTLTSNTIPELKVFLFNEGRTLESMPTFRINEPDKFPNGPLNLHRDEDGNLVAYSAITDYEQTN